MFNNEETHYRDLSGNYHIKTEVYKQSYNIALFASAHQEGLEGIQIIIGSVAQVAHLLEGDERDSYFGLLDGLDDATKEF